MVASPDEFARVMRYLQASVGMVGDRQPPPEQVQVYFDLLGHWPFDVLMQAAQRAIAEHRYPNLPPVGLVAQHAQAILNPPALVAEAWRQVLAVARKWDFWLIEMPTQEDTLRRLRADMANLPPQARAAANNYGWRTILETDPGVAFAQFRGVSESLAGRERTEAALPPAARLPKSVAGVVGEIGRLRAADLGSREPAANGSAPAVVAESAPKGGDRG
jgi:hypothetical protein